MQPVHKKTKHRKRTRRSHHAMTPRELQACPQCGQARRSHFACANCGHFSSRVRIATGTEES